MTGENGSPISVERARGYFYRAASTDANAKWFLAALEKHRSRNHDSLASIAKCLAQFDAADPRTKFFQARALGPNEDPERSQALMTEAANANFGPACGALYSYYLGDDAEGIAWLERGVSLGDLMSISLLAQEIRDGPERWNYLLEAAERGDFSSMVSVATDMSTFPMELRVRFLCEVVVSCRGYEIALAAGMALLKFCKDRQCPDNLPLDLAVGAATADFIWGMDVHLAGELPNLVAGIPYLQDCAYFFFHVEDTVRNAAVCTFLCLGRIGLPPEICQGVLRFIVAHAEDEQWLKLASKSFQL